VTNEAPLLKVVDLTKVYGSTPVVDRVNLTVERGEIVMIVGPSGAGKSTVLRCINRIEVPYAGDVIVDGVNMGGELRGGKLVADSTSQTARKRQKIGMVFQRFNLFSHLKMQFAREVGTRLVFMDGGRIIEDTKPDEFFARRAREFLRRVNRPEDVENA
jgi:ABC-type polar amino acid transport system ATPase subunit